MKDLFERFGNWFDKWKETIFLFLFSALLTWCIVFLSIYSILFFMDKV